MLPVDFCCMTFPLLILLEEYDPLHLNFVCIAGFDVYGHTTLKALVLI